MPDVPLARLGPISGRKNDVGVTLTDLSFRQTSTGRRYPYPDFGSDFIEALHKALAAPRHRGLVRSTLVCPSCEASLDGIAVGRVNVATPVDLKRIPPIRVEVEMPGMTCPGCALTLVRVDDREVESGLSDALIAAFDAAGVVPG